jgi:hypothetical protein
VKRGVLWLIVLVVLAGSTFLESPAAAAKSRKKRKTKTAAAANFDTKLPVLGTRLSEFPPGPAKALADQACLNCHSADMVWQQHLTEKQWTAEINKMIGWGSEVAEENKQALIAYLVANFGPENDKFQPVVTRPVGK